MTQVGEGVEVTQPMDDIEADGLYLLRFMLEDKQGNPIPRIPYKTVLKGSSAEPLHIADGKTTQTGLTPIVSSVRNEEVDFYIAWTKLTVNKGWLKF